MRLRERLGKDWSYAYHRTKPENIESIAENGFRPGWGDMYGKGFYMTYDLDSQLRSGMTHYGRGLIRVKVDMKGVLILDYNVSKKIYGNNYTIVDQLLHFGIFNHEYIIPPFYVAMSKVLEESLNDPSLSAVIAAHTVVGGTHPKEAVKQRFSYANRYGEKNSLIGSNGTPKLAGITGIMFTGNHDGNVLVSYAHDISLPYEYAITDSSGDIVQDWESIKAIKTAEKRVEKAKKVLEIFQGKVKKLNTNLDADQVVRLHDWLLKADFIGAEITIEEDGKVIWENGVWKRGEWHGDVWRGGEWKQGKWKRGVFASGTWNAGNFLGGQFGDDSLDAIRNEGTPVWKKGTWTNGVFKKDYAVWEKGDIFKDGNFVSSKSDPISFFGESVEEKDLFELNEEINEFISFQLDESFKYHDLDQEEQDELFNKFKQSYEKAVGVAWDRGRFESRARDWIFFGSKEGGIALRRQRSGLYKLNATFGSPKSVVNAFHEMMSEIGNEPIWGIMTLSLAEMLQKLSNKEFKMPPKLFAKTVIPHISHIFGDVVKTVNPDGGIVVDTPAGEMTKYFIANKKYYHDLIDMAKNNPDKVPIPKSVLNTLIGILKFII